MQKIAYYIRLFTTDRAAFRFQLWMVWNRYKITVVKWCFARYTNVTHSILTVHHRPLMSSDVNTWSSEVTSARPKFAIMLQGPLVHPHNFTRETVRIYTRHFPNTDIVVSTDESEPASAIQQLKDAGAIVVQSPLPAARGIGNINIQLTSTLAGLTQAKALGAEYVYKTRCDQRMYAPNLNEFLYQLLQTFPVQSGYTQKQRIVASSLATLKYVPYLITDMWQFGHIDDLLSYWSDEHDTRPPLTTPVRTVQNLIEANVNESRLCRNFLTRIGRPVAGTIADSWQAYADHFCIVDRLTLDLFWYKYDSYQEHPFRRYHGIGNDTLLTFADWLVLYSNRNTLPPAPHAGLPLGRNELLPSPTLTI